MSKTTGTPGARDEGRSGRHQSRLSIAALVLAVLAIPAALFPWLGLVVAVIVLAVGLVALIRALRSPVITVGYPMTAVVIAIAAVALAGIVTNGTANQLEDCDAQTDEEVEQCLEDGRTDG
jgi:hypothetical protein